MMVIFVSQCEKKALAKTRRVLDAFANRIGDNTWQTLITEEGLKTVYKMLRKTASKSSAVSCHWIRSRSRSQLLWVVGNKRKFNAEGIVPVNSTEKNLLLGDVEQGWKYLPLIKAFTGLAALLHDWGKATKLFQDKLHPKSKDTFKGDPLRHEWISSLLIMALIQLGKESESEKDSEKDDGWLNILLTQSIDEQKLITALPLLKEERRPFSHLPNAAALLLWLVLSHHRLPKAKNKASYGDRANASPQQLLSRLSKEWGYENILREGEDKTEFQQRLEDCFSFPQGLLSESECWRSQLSEWAYQIKSQLPLFDQAIKDGSWRTIAHYARLCLMVGDHYYSSQRQDSSWHSSVNLFANTYRDGPEKGQLKQRLDEHLVKVAEVAVNTCGMLPRFEYDTPTADGIQIRQPVKTLSSSEKKQIKKQFGWQDKAVKKINTYRQQNNDKIGGCFIVNMASTGRGKTLANAKIMQVLSDDQQSLRFTLALGLRTLTLQTGDEYRDRIGLEQDELAVLIGSKAILELHQNSGKERVIEEQTPPEAEFGSESAEPLLGEQEEVFGGDEAWQNLLPEEELTTVLTGRKERALLYAPVLACTIDHLMAATETTRGGRYILPSLRLMSADLVIDEIDDFTGSDMVAIGRLIYLAGMLGRKVMISSATIPPGMALAYFTAYQKGWVVFANSHHQSTRVACGWTDEFDTKINSINLSEQSAINYELDHQDFIKKREAKLRVEPVKQRGEVVSLPKLSDSSTYKEEFFSVIQQALLQKHEQHHETDLSSGRQVSFGVVRCANIQPCVQLTEYLLDASWPEEVEVRVMAYHSQQVLLLRHEQEQHLDQVLKRKIPVNDPKGAFHHPIIRQHLDEAESKHVIFILVATPVEEVGRDHDFDWALIEPSSYRSFIQLAGRVRRHRGADVDNEEPNMGFLEFNLKGYQGKTKDVFSRPGYEGGKWQLYSKSLNDVVDSHALLQGVNAIPRIKKSDDADFKTSLVALEHAVIEDVLGCNYLKNEEGANKAANSPKSLWGYIDDYWWMTALPQQFHRFRDSAPSLNIYRVINDDQQATFYIYDRQRGWLAYERMLGIDYEPLTAEQTQRLWLVRDYKNLITDYATAKGQEVERASQLLGELSLQYYQEGNRYSYNDQLGLVKKGS